MIGEERVLTVTPPPPGARFKGYHDLVVQELGPAPPRVIRYRRERWRTADGRTLVAPPPAGTIGHFGPELRRFVLLQHHHAGRSPPSGWRARLLNGLGLLIAKRRVVRRLNDRAEASVAEAEAVLRAGPATARRLTVDDTGARHRARNGVTTRLGDDRLTFFATGFSKSRRNFLALPRADRGDYVIDAAALAYMRAHHLAGPVIDRLEGAPAERFADAAAWRERPEALGPTALGVTHPIRSSSPPRARSGAASARTGCSPTRRSSATRPVGSE